MSGVGFDQVYLSFFQNIWPMSSVLITAKGILHSAAQNDQDFIIILERIMGLVRCLTRSVMWLRSVGDGVDSDPTGLQINHNQHPR